MSLEKSVYSLKQSKLSINGGCAALIHPTADIANPEDHQEPSSFPCAAWECSAGRAASRIRNVTRGVARPSTQLRAGLDCIPTQRVTAIKLRNTLVSRLLLGNPVSKALSITI